MAMPEGASGADQHLWGEYRAWTSGTAGRFVQGVKTGKAFYPQ